MSHHPHHQSCGIDPKPLVEWSIVASLRAVSSSNSNRVDGAVVKRQPVDPETSDEEDCEEEEEEISVVECDQEQSRIVREADARIDSEKECSTSQCSAATENNNSHSSSNHNNTHGATGSITGGSNTTTLSLLEKLPVRFGRRRLEPDHSDNNPGSSSLSRKKADPPCDPPESHDYSNHNNDKNEFVVGDHTHDDDEVEQQINMNRSESSSLESPSPPTQTRSTAAVVAAVAADPQDTSTKNMISSSSSSSSNKNNSIAVISSSGSSKRSVQFDSVQVHEHYYNTSPGPPPTTSVQKTSRVLTGGTVTDNSHHKDALNHHRPKFGERVIGSSNSSSRIDNLNKYSSSEAIGWDDRARSSSVSMISTLDEYEALRQASRPPPSLRRNETHPVRDTLNQTNINRGVWEREGRTVRPLLWQRDEPELGDADSTSLPLTTSTASTFKNQHPRLVQSLPDVTREEPSSNATKTRRSLFFSRGRSKAKSSAHRSLIQM